jgi:hypothetical protein
MISRFWIFLKKTQEREGCVVHWRRADVLLHHTGILPVSYFGYRPVTRNFPN